MGLLFFCWFFFVGLLVKANISLLLSFQTAAITNRDGNAETTDRYGCNKYILFLATFDVQPIIEQATIGFNKHISNCIFLLILASEGQIMENRPIEAFFVEKIIPLCLP